MHHSVTGRLEDIGYRLVIVQKNLKLHIFNDLLTYEGNYESICK